MKMIIPVNERIACEPPPSVQAAIKTQNGFARVQQKVQLTKLKVVYGNEHHHTAPKVLCPTNSFVYVNGESMATAQWAKQVYELDGTRFILVPENQIYLVDVDGNAGDISVQDASSTVENDKPPLIKEIF